MLEDIKTIKTNVLKFMEQEVSKYGNNRMDVQEIGLLADIVKDLAEAEYYCTVAEAMKDGQDSMGYSGGRMMGYGQGGGSSMANGGGTGGGRSSYGGMMGHSDPISAIRDMLMTANPDQRESIRYELSNLMK